MAMPTTILIVDDHPLFRKGLRTLLEGEQDFKVIGEAGDGRQGIDRTRELSPDVVVMDITMPDFNGIDATRQIISESPETKVMAISMHSGKKFIEDMLRAGAAGYILKECAPEELINGLRTVIRGEIYLSASVTETVVSAFVRGETDVGGGGQDGKTADVAVTVIETKLRRPPISGDHLRRPRLLEKLEKGRRGILTLVSAPAGYGKSTLVSQWLESDDGPSAWFSVDEDDNNFRQFMVYFLSAIQTMFPDAASNTMALVTTGGSNPLRVLVSSLLNDLNLIDQDYLLAIDDVHLVHEEQVNELLIELLHYPPQHMHLVLVGRRDPFLPISAMRAKGRITEIGVRDLCFTMAETGDYLHHVLKQPVEEKTAAAWMQKTEGWVTGLRLAAISMYHTNDATRMLSIMPDGIQYVTEYLFNEVFTHQSPEMQRFLTRTAVLDRFCAPLCAAMWLDGEDSEPDDRTGWDYILRLKKENLFVISLDAENRWFRFHHLFRSLLQSQLKRRFDTEAIAALHGMAGCWFADNGLIDEAIRHKLAANDMNGVSQLVEQARQTMLNNDKWSVFEKWLPIIPDTVIQQRPELLMAQIWVHYFNFRFSLIPPILDVIDSIIGNESKHNSLLGEICLFKGVLFFMQGDGLRSLKFVEDALDRIPVSHPMVRGFAETYLGLAGQMQGQQERVVGLLSDLVYHASLPDVRKLRVIIGLVWIHIISGDLTAAAGFNQQLRKLAAHSHSNAFLSWGSYNQGLIHFHRDELDAAVDHFSQAAERSFLVLPRAHVDCLTGICLAYQAMGQTEKADATMARLLEHIQPLNDPALTQIAHACRIRLSLMKGETTIANGWPGTSHPTRSGAFVIWLENPAITECRALLAEGSDKSIDEAQNQLQELLTLNQAHHNTCQTIGIMILLALAAYRRGRLMESLKVLEKAVGLAAPGGWIRPFIEPGRAIAELLKRLVLQNQAVDFIKRILTGFPDGTETKVTPAPAATTPSQILVDPLTNRELEVLELLQQRLQTKEIAGRLYISTETVKSHLKNIYQKLAVGNRLKAVEKAKTLGLL